MDGLRRDFDCTMVTAPLDWADPSGGDIELSLIRSRAEGGDAIGSLLTNPGGPGVSGVELIRDSRRLRGRRAAAAAVRRHRLRPPRRRRSPRRCAATTRRTWTPTCSTSPRRRADPMGGPRSEPSRITALRRGVRREQRRHPAFHHDRERRSRHGSAARRARRRPSCTTWATRTARSSVRPTPSCIPERVGGLVLDGAVDPTVSLGSSRTPFRGSASSRRCARTWPTA